MIAVVGPSSGGATLRTPAEVTALLASLATLMSIVAQPKGPRGLLQMHLGMDLQVKRVVMTTLVTKIASGSPRQRSFLRLRLSPPCFEGPSSVPPMIISLAREPDKFLSPPPAPPILCISAWAKEKLGCHELLYIMLDCMVFCFLLVSFLALTSSACTQRGHDSHS